MLKRDGWHVGRNVIYRPYREEELVLRTKRPRRRKMVVHREARCQPKRPNEAWTLDFIHDQLSNGQKFRALTVVDVFSREALAIEVGSACAANMWSRYSIGWCGSVGRRNTCLPTTAANSPVIWSICGPTTMASGSTSRGPANRPTTPISRRLMVAARRAFECALVRDHRPCPAADRGLEKRI